MGGKGRQGPVEFNKMFATQCTSKYVEKLTNLCPFPDYHRELRIFFIVTILLGSRNTQKD